ncbi:MAG: RNase adapter RapZ [Actinomycetota bacterium]
MNVRRRARVIDVTVITGLSGAGRSEAAKALEDMGWFVIDNLPPQLISKTMSLAIAPGNDIGRIALVIDARGGQFFKEATRALEKLRRDVCNFRLLFLEASDEELVRRFDASRRRHPLAIDDTIAVGIQRERELMRPFREGADVIIETTDLPVRKLRAKIATAFSDGDVATEGLKINVISFGYKFGLPLDADIVLDVRFLPNPYWVPELKDLEGLDVSVRDYVLQQPATDDFLVRTKDLFSLLLPGYQGEGRHYLTVAIGCTGGRHRSVVLAEQIGSIIREHDFAVKVIHRDIERDTAG